jgi:glycosyltransferase involved in cell wall biosynthesis
LKTVVNDVFVYPTRRGAIESITRLALLGVYPSHVAARRLGPKQRAEVDNALAAFEPDLIWSEGCYPALEAARAARAAGLNWVYRSHNIEHLYMPRQALAARRLRDRLAWRLACIGLKPFEEKMIRQAGWVFDVSHDDMAFWQARGVSHISWLAPLAEAMLQTIEDKPPAVHANQLDVLFLGNLMSPNNVRGVEWLVEDIRPLVLKARPDTQFTIAGSNPSAHVVAVCRAANVKLIANPPDAIALYRAARVLVNPVRTGSGTHVKAIEMLMMQAPIVTATQGTCGLPAEIKQLFRVADSAADFAHEIVTALAADAASSPRQLARHQFGLGGLEEALAKAPLDRLAARQMPSAPTT